LSFYQVLLHLAEPHLPVGIQLKDFAFFQGNTQHTTIKNEAFECGGRGRPESECDFGRLHLSDSFFIKILVSA
jgi:hypothetical protein